MSKKELISRVFNKVTEAGCTKSQVKTIIEMTFEEMKHMVASDGECRIPGCFTLKKYLRKERQALHPVTRAPITVPAKNSIKVSISTDFKDLIQEGE